MLSTFESQSRSFQAHPYAKVNTPQTDIIQRNNDLAFREKLVAYLAAEWAEDVGDQDLEDVVASAITDDCPRLEVCREMDIVIMCVARLRISGLVASKDFWNAVIAQRPNPNQRAGAFLTEMIVGLDRVDTVAFYRRVNGWSEFVKGNI